MKIMLTGGGTGGHIYPALAIAEKLKKEYKGVEIIYVGSKRGMEKDIVPRSGIQFLSIEAAPLNKKIGLGTLKSFGLNIKGLIQANRLIKRHAPDVVVGTGGYVAGAVVLIAAIRGIPTAIHEQNAFPGLTNRILSRFVDRIMLSFEDAKTHFKYPDKIVYTGLPIMSAFFTGSREAARQKLGFKDDELVVLSVGGSNGALKLNQILMETYGCFKEYEQLRLVHVAGERYFKTIQKEMNNQVYNLGDHFKLMSFLKDMPTYLKAADLVISRAGASTINEIIASGTPSVIIPSPNVSNDHQAHNAKIMDRHGLGIVLREADLTVELMVHIITDFYNDRSKLDIMRSNCEKLDLSNTLDSIFMVINQLYKDRH